MFWNFSPGGTSSSKAQNPPFLQSTSLNADADRLRQQQPAAVDGLPPPPGVDPNRPAAGATRSIFDINFRDAYARQWNLNVPAQLRHATTWWKSPTSDRRAGRCCSRATRTRRRRWSASATRTSTGRSSARAGAADASARSQSIGTVDYNGLLVKFQRRFANNFSFLNSYTFGKAIDLQLGQRRHGHADQRLRSAVQPRAVRLRHHATRCRSSWIYELPWARNKLYGGWQVSGILLLRGGLPLTVTQTQGVQSTGTGNRPNQICDGKLDNPTIDRWFDTSCFVPPTDADRHLRRRGPRHHPRARARSTSTRR